MDSILGFINCHPLSVRAMSGGFHLSGAYYLLPLPPSGSLSLLCRPLVRRQASRRVLQT